MTEPLRRALAELSEQTPAVRVRPDLWQLGRRRRRRRAAALAAAVVLMVALPLGLAGPAARGPLTGRPAGGGGDAVPARVHQPYPWQGTVQQAPTGPAALLVTGGGSGLAGADLPGTFGSRVAVIGRDGSYRMLRYGGTYLQAAQDVLLSPDGRHVAGDETLERRTDQSSGAVVLRHRTAISVVDLVDGSVRWYRDLPAGEPVAWSPDGSRLVLQRPDLDYPNGLAPPVPRVGRLFLLDLATGATRELTGLPTGSVRRATFLAFSPDGRRLAVQVGRTVSVVDTADGGARTLAQLGERDRLAGAGAWTPDGGIAVFSHGGCVDPCTDVQRNDRRWRLLRLDAGTGTIQPAPGAVPEVAGAAVRMLGWPRDGHPVVLRYLLPSRDGTPWPEVEEQTGYRAVHDVELLALHPDGGRRLVATPPGAVWDLDVARDLLLDGRFGGPAPRPAPLPAAPWLYGLLAAVVLPVGAILALWWRRRPRPGAPPPPPPTPRRGGGTPPAPPRGTAG